MIKLHELKYKFLNKYAELEYLPKINEIKESEIVYTSGSDGTIPASLPVGKIILKDNKKPVTKAGAYAKYYASEVSVRCGNEAIQVMGGYGYTKEYPAEKFLRDAKLMTIGEGTSEIQKIVISREILK